MSVLHRVAGDLESHRHATAVEARDCEAARREGRRAPAGRLHSVPSAPERASAAAGMARIVGGVR